MKTAIALLLTLGLLAAGCVAPPDGEGPATPAPGEGAMTAKETRREEVGLCTDPFPVLPQGGAFCATRVILVEGDVRGLAALEVDLSTFNGDVDLRGGDGAAWNLTAILTARGATEAEATANLERIKFAWSHAQDGVHALSARAEPDGSSDDGTAATLLATLPRDVTLVASLATSNGDVRVDAVATDGLAARTANGGVAVDARVTQVDLGASNGRVEAALEPTGSGRISAATANGAIRLVLPESPRHGYDVEAQTLNGEASIRLRDGEVRSGDQSAYDPRSVATFTTTRFGARDVQSSVSVVAVNGDVTVEPR